MRVEGEIRPFLQSGKELPQSKSASRDPRSVTFPQDDAWSDFFTRLVGHEQHRARLPVRLWTSAPFSQIPEFSKKRTARPDSRPTGRSTPKKDFRLEISNLGFLARAPAAEDHQGRQAAGEERPGGGLGDGDGVPRGANADFVEVIEHACIIHAASENEVREGAG